MSETCDVFLLRDRNRDTSECGRNRVSEKMKIPNKIMMLKVLVSLSCLQIKTSLKSLFSNLAALTTGLKEKIDFLPLKLLNFVCFSTTSVCLSVCHSRLTFCTFSGKIFRTKILTTLYCFWKQLSFWKENDVSREIESIDDIMLNTNGKNEVLAKEWTSREREREELNLTLTLKLSLTGET